MPFFDIQKRLGINLDRGLTIQSAEQPYKIPTRCHAFEKEWIECAHGIGGTRAKKECKFEYDDFLECMLRQKTVRRWWKRGVGFFSLSFFFFCGGALRAVFCVWATPNHVFRTYTWLCTQGPLLWGLLGYYGVQRMEPGLTVCKASALLPVLFINLDPTESVFVFFFWHWGWFPVLYYWIYLPNLQFLGQRDGLEGWSACFACGVLEMYGNSNTQEATFGTMLGLAAGTTEYDYPPHTPKVSNLLVFCSLYMLFACE